MSSQPECRVCGDYVHHGPVTCGKCRDTEIEQLRVALLACHYQMGVNMLGKDRDFVLAYNKADDIVGPKTSVKSTGET